MKPIGMKKATIHSCHHKSNSNAITIDQPAVVKAASAT